MNQQQQEDGRSTRHRERRELIVRLFQEHGSTRKVADILGTTTSLVGRALKIEGLATPRHGRRNPYSRCNLNAELVLKMSAEGCSLSEIGRTVKTKKEEVKKFLERNGIVKTYDSGSANTGERHYSWKGRLVDKQGYILIHQKGHPNARKHTHYVFEHRLVMERVLGRVLLPTEVVHHKDGNKQNNDPENLQVFENNGKHLAVDLAGRCPKWSEEGKERIRKAVRLRWSRWRASNLAQSKADDQQCI
jgi:hypothetical protein